MHDKKFAQEIKKIVIDKLEDLDEQTNLIAINVRLSPFSHVRAQTLKEAFALEVEYSKLKSAILNINMGEVEVECSFCGGRFIVTNPTFSCLDCGSTDLHIRQGPEFYVESIEVEKNLK